MTREEEIAARKAKLAAREGRVRLTDNVRALKERIAELEREA